MNIEILSIIMFFGILAIIIYRDRKNIEFNSGLMMRRTNRGKKIIYDIAEKHRKKLRIIGNIAILAGVIVLIVGLFLLVQSSYKIISKPEEATQGIKLVLPSVSGIKLPGFALSIPFWYWILGIFVVLFAHEPMHALLARAEKIRIKSFGLLLLVVLPGAFVDPDEKQIKKLSTLKKLRIYAAGSFGNLMVAFIFLLLITPGYNFLIDFLMSPKGVFFEKTIENTGASGVGLTGTITEINGLKVESMENFLNLMKDVKPGDVIDIKTTEGYFQVKTSSNPEDSTQPYIGISNAKTLFVYKGILKNFDVVSGNTEYIFKNISLFIYWLSGLFFWIFVLNMGIGTFNLFPIKPLDGGLMFEEIVRYFYKGKKVKYLVNGISLITISLVLINLFGPSVIGWVKLLFT